MSTPEEDREAGGLRLVASNAGAESADKNRDRRQPAKNLFIAALARTAHIPAPILPQPVVCPSHQIPDAGGGVLQHAGAKR